MRKQTKVVAVASAAALLAIGGAMTSFAAQGWVEEDGTWYYYDKDGNREENEWRKSGDSWFWLDGDEGGAMATDKVIEDESNYYYVDGNGVMVTNTWVKVVNEDQDDDDDPAEYRYYYMQNSGKAYKAKDSGNTTFKFCYLCGNSVVGRVLQTSVEIPCVFKIKQTSHVFAAVILECCALVDR